MTGFFKFYGFIQTYHTKVIFSAIYQTGMRIFKNNWHKILIRKSEVGSLVPEVSVHLMAVGSRYFICFKTPITYRNLQLIISNSQLLTSNLPVSIL